MVLLRVNLLLNFKSHQNIFATKSLYSEPASHYEGGSYSKSKKKLWILQKLFIVASTGLIAFSHARVIPRPGMFDCLTILPINRFPNKLALNAITMSRKPPFCYFASFFIVLLTLFTSKPDFLKV